MLTPIEMERVLENIDRRLTAIEQTLPTLATSDQLATLATVTLVEQRFEDSKQFARQLNEDTNDKIRLVAEGVDDLRRRVDDLSTRQEFTLLSNTVDDVKVVVGQVARGLATLTTRLEQKGVI